MIRVSGDLGREASAQHSLLDFSKCLAEPLKEDSASFMADKAISSSDQYFGYPQAVMRPCFYERG